ncbi:hypothetical protein RFI_34027 [Reticulomyxa filosa]|uniref:Uncharacterized protein n=1 Tax=Reticulomyxa filosa TaxID=46433 RepID=X6LNB2_RETFI|nr:hypothetical protein RFI_34027 [Reticulomyxa filosa]|eukprot:ETO03383.1 hypothetical protein RFI_34027 [Reticulomyxa filosa]
MIKQLESRMQHYIQKSNCRKICKDEEWSNCVLIFDNILKMVTIFMKIRANTHVILMSETGCGKTFLIKFLGAMKFFLLALQCARIEQLEKIIKILSRFEAENVYVHCFRCSQDG